MTNKINLIDSNLALGPFTPQSDSGREANTTLWRAIFRQIRLSLEDDFEKLVKRTTKRRYFAVRLKKYDE